MTVIIKLIVLVIFIFQPAMSLASELLKFNADESRDPYKIINKHLVESDGNAIESPDCGHKEFGPHITQEFDYLLKKTVFRFYLHLELDDDRCKNQDRQRNEIKVYDKSPEWLKARKGDEFTYSWKFKIDQTFQASNSFTHLHQLKAVGGRDKNPLLTFTARIGSEGEASYFEVRHNRDSKAKKLIEFNLDGFVGEWVFVKEKIKFGPYGSYYLEIKSIKTGKPIINYENNSIYMWSEDAIFIRPKWGIYRSLNEKNMIKDEVISYADFYIYRH